MTPDLLLALCTARGLDPDDLPESAGWDEGLEQRISQVAESYDPETRTCRPLGPRRSW
jgi:hypothetical protein